MFFRLSRLVVCLITACCIIRSISSSVKVPSWSEKSETSSREMVNNDGRKIFLSYLGKRDQPGCHLDAEVEFYMQIKWPFITFSSLEVHHFSKCKTAPVVKIATAIAYQSCRYCSAFKALRLLSSTEHLLRTQHCSNLPWALHPVSCSLHQVL